MISKSTVAVATLSLLSQSAILVNGTIYNNDIITICYLQCGGYMWPYSYLMSRSSTGGHYVELLETKLFGLLQ